MTKEHSLQADLLPEEINDNDIFRAQVTTAQDKRIVSLEKIRQDTARIIDAIEEEKEGDKKGPRITVNIYFPNQRAYDVAWGIAKLSDYEDLDEFINDAFLKTLEMYPEGTASLDMEEDDWGFKSRWQKDREEKEQAKISR